MCQVSAGFGALAVACRWGHLAVRQQAACRAKPRRSLGEFDDGRTSAAAGSVHERFCMTFVELAACRLRVCPAAGAWCLRGLHCCGVRTRIWRLSSWPSPGPGRHACIRAQSALALGSGCACWKPAILETANAHRAAGACLVLCNYKRTRCSKVLQHQLHQLLPALLRSTIAQVRNCASLGSKLCYSAVHLHHANRLHA
jgi:hypothetical protein